MQLLFATSNSAKYTAMRDALQPLGISLICLKDMEQVPTAPEEGISPLENARQKALYYYDCYGIPLFPVIPGCIWKGSHRSCSRDFMCVLPRACTWTTGLCRTIMEDWQPNMGISLPDITTPSA